MNTTASAPDRALSIVEFCAIERICKSSYYKMRRSGVGPEEFVIPGTTIIRITPAAHVAWREHIKKLATTKGAKLEREHRQRSAADAAKVAVASPRHTSKKKSKRGRR
jgi:hypothetical protein